MQSDIVRKRNPAGGRAGGRKQNRRGVIKGRGGDGGDYNTLLY